jgi:hypothetical protein
MCEIGLKRDKVNSSIKALVKIGLRHPNLKALQGVVKPSGLHNRPKSLNPHHKKNK